MGVTYRPDPKAGTRKPIHTTPLANNNLTTSHDRSLNGEALSPRGPAQRIDSRARGSTAAGPTTPTPGPRGPTTSSITATATNTCRSATCSGSRWRCSRRSSGKRRTGGASTSRGQAPTLPKEFTPRGSGPGTVVRGKGGELVEISGQELQGHARGFQVTPQEASRRRTLPAASGSGSRSRSATTPTRSRAGSA